MKQPGKTDETSVMFIGVLLPRGAMAQMMYQGKVKQVWSTDDPGVIEFRYTDQISVFDQIIPSLVPRKGESLNRTTCHWFNLVEQEGICETHLIEMNAPDRCLARKFEVIKEPGAIPRDMENVFVPLEVICRHHLAGSGWRRYERGDVGSEEFGFEPGQSLEMGVKLPRPYLEVSTKFEKFDRLLDRQEALEISNLTDEEFDAILDCVLAIDEIIEREASARGLIHVDGKKEFALGDGRKPVLVDSFGTLDEDRWWDAETYEKGQIVSLSKEFVREYYLGTGHHTELYQARKSGTTEPPIPPLPGEIISRTANLYSEMFERLTGTPF
ncbi:MAG: phosphoribosylaminoimidazolesuccinocarboxamide synthase [Candidatus Thalassarchaeaceae archaeon]|jgi:phosphoribosylaminoimidazole-succinocarboxamide synthase|nr:phosphoribosylaminoimidazolesuccinocarboxamide synthase [Candidatus Thalassarchaeaceae archaeon]|tara:strand:- start:6340 stop:7320 length:981 start_codon:yes stop_codon:yes gene_type:complete